MKHQSFTRFGVQRFNRCFINKFILSTAAFLLLTIGILWAFGQQLENRALVVSNAHAQQREGTFLVDITYDVEDAEGDEMTISVQVSDDGGKTFNVPAKTFTGDIGSGITSGKDKHIVWDAGADAPHIFGSSFCANIIADDGVTDEPTPCITRQKDGTKMRLIPEGEFSMGDHHDVGSNDEKPVHIVYLDDYYIDETEVTNAQFKKFLEANPEWRKDRIDSKYVWNKEYYLRDWNGMEYPSGEANHPVIYVSWYAAAAYAQWAGVRLPTEAQWEKAARGGLVGRKYPLGDTITHDDANYWKIEGKDIWEKTSPVGSFPANGYGLFDMAGNVWEWCADEYDSGYYSKSPKNNPTGPGVPILFVNNDFTNVKKSASCVLRGGSWYRNTLLLRCANRARHSANYSIITSGFRCSQDF